MGRERAGFATCYLWLLHSSRLIIVGVALWFIARQVMLTTEYMLWHSRTPVARSKR